MYSPNHRTQKIQITVVIPCYNEVNYIKICLDSLLEQTINKESYEIIVADGFSNDGTRKILDEYKSNFNNIFVFGNSKRITSAACNIGIKNSRGDYIAICGAHNKYNADYLENCMKIMDEYPEVDCVGGPVYSNGINSFSKSAALALSSVFGIGNAKHRFKNAEGYGLISQYPFFRKSIFNKIGFYNEGLRLNEDDEFFYRMKNAKINSLISSTIKSLYYVRSNPQKLYNQYFNYGYWRWKVYKDYKVTFAVRQLIPSFFILSMVVLVISGIALNNLLISVFVPVFYSIILFGAGIQKSFIYGIKLGGLFPFAVLILHFSYGLGFFKSFLDNNFIKR